VNVTLAAFFVLFYLFVYLSRAIGVAIRSLHGYAVMRKNQALNWLDMLNDLDAGSVAVMAQGRPAWHIRTVTAFSTRMRVRPHELLHAIIIPTLNASLAGLEPTIQSILRSNYPMKQVILVLAYEERGGEKIAVQAEELIKDYKDKFYNAFAICHPKNIEGEVKGKGGNATYAGRTLQKYFETEHIDPVRVIVTTLDADNRPDKEYLPCLSYAYCLCPDPVRSAFQPVSMYTNNIWDAPAPMRVLATGNSMYNIVVSMRPHTMRNFSAHAQGMASLIQTDFWSVRTIVEDGHQFWRSYFRFDGNYVVYPLHVPIYQDAVLTDSYRKTLRAQFIQLRRWTYGASDIAYVVHMGYFKRNTIPKFDLTAKTARLIEAHVSWAAAPILSLIGGFIPSLFHPHSLAADQLPLIVSRIQTCALLLTLVMIFLCLKTLPPKPARYKRHRTLLMILQWAYLPVTTIIYNSFAAYYSQTRLALGKYMDKFDVTEKAVVSPTSLPNAVSVPHKG